MANPNWKGNCTTYLLVLDGNLARAVGGGVELVGEVLDDGALRHGIEATQVLLHLGDLPVREPERGPRRSPRHPNLSGPWLLRLRTPVR